MYNDTIYGTKYPSYPTWPIVFEDSRKYPGRGGKDLVLKIMRFTNIPLNCDIRGVNVYNTAYVCYNDICNAMGLKNHADRVKQFLDNAYEIANENRPKFDKRELPYLYFNIEGGNQYGSVQYYYTLFISESSLYKVIFRSNTTQAILFTDWVTHDVLPKIRQIALTQRGTNTMLCSMMISTRNAIDDNNKSIKQLEEEVKRYNQFIQNDYGKAGYMQSAADQLYNQNVDLRYGMGADVRNIALNSAAAAVNYADYYNKQQQQEPDIVADQY